MKPLQNGDITPPFTNIGKSRTSHKCLTSQICLLTVVMKIKFSRNFLNLHYSEVFEVFTLYVEWLQLLKHLFINVPYHIRVASLTLVALSGIVRTGASLHYMHQKAFEIVILRTVKIIFL